MAGVPSPWACALAGARESALHNVCRRPVSEVTIPGWASAAYSVGAGGAFEPSKRMGSWAGDDACSRGAARCARASMVQHSTRSVHAVGRRLKGREQDEQERCAHAHRVRHHLCAQRLARALKA